MKTPYSETAENQINETNHLNKKSPVGCTIRVNKDVKRRIEQKNTPLEVVATMKILVVPFG